MSSRLKNEETFASRCCCCCFNCWDVDEEEEIEPLLKTLDPDYSSNKEGRKTKEKFLNFKKCLLKDIDDVTMKTDDVKIALPEVGVAIVDRRLNDYSLLYNDHLDRWDHIVDQLQLFKRRLKNCGPGGGADDDGDDEDDDDGGDVGGGRDGGSGGGGSGGKSGDSKEDQYRSFKDVLKDFKALLEQTDDYDIFNLSEYCFQVIRRPQPDNVNYIKGAPNNDEGKDGAIVADSKKQQQKKKLQKIVSTFNNVNVELREIIERCPSLVRLLKNVSTSNVTLLPQQKNPSPKQIPTFDNVEHFIDDTDVDDGGVGGLGGMRRGQKNVVKATVSAATATTTDDDNEYEYYYDGISVGKRHDDDDDDFNDVKSGGGGGGGGDGGGGGGGGGNDVVDSLEKSLENNSQALPSNDDYYSGDGEDDDGVFKGDDDDDDDNRVKDDSRMKPGSDVITVQPSQQQSPLHQPQPPTPPIKTAPPPPPSPPPSSSSLPPTKFSPSSSLSSAVAAAASSASPPPPSPAAAAATGKEAPAPITPPSSPTPTPPQSPSPPPSPTKAPLSPAVSKLTKDNLLKTLSNDSSLSMGGVRADLKRSILMAGLDKGEALRAVNQFKSNLDALLQAASIVEIIDIAGKQIWHHEYDLFHPDQS